MVLLGAYDYATDRHLLDELAFRHRPVRWIVPIDLQGRLIGDGLIDTSDPSHKKGQQYAAPVTIRPKDAGGVAEFLADGLTSIFGVDADPDKLKQLPEMKRRARQNKNAKKYQDFWEQIDQTNSPLTNAMIQFQKRYADGNTPQIKIPHLRWGLSPANDAPNNKPKRWLCQAGGSQIPMGSGDAFTFSVDGQVVLMSTTLREIWSSRSKAERGKRAKSARKGACLITGRLDTPIAATNPKIKSIPGTLSMGANLVSFDKNAFTSFGFDQGHNAPISIDAANAYAAALNHLLTDDKTHIRIGPSVLCFWARTQADFSSGLAALLTSPLPESVKNFFDRWRVGIEPSVAQDRFYVVVLSGNAGRVVVRYWIDEPLSRAVENVERWFDDLAIDEMPRAAPKSADKMHSWAIFRLACATVRDPKDLVPGKVTLIFRAALEGLPLPLTILQPLLHRFRCDLTKSEGAYPWNPSRFALLKLILTRLARQKKENAFMPDNTLIADTDDVPYNLGRFLAVLEQLQDKAHQYKLEGAGVIERYYGTASSAPAHVFPLLCRLARHHLKKLEGLGEKGKKDAYFIEQEMQSVLGRIRADKPGCPPEFPRLLNLEQQGRFALGFYQEKVHTAQAIADAKERRTSNSQ